MKNIIKIFLSDIKGLVKNFFALVIAIGLCILPCLYAWFNIYSNWDPYANTSTIKIAVASEDQDYSLEDGTVVNMGNEIVEELKENSSIGWVFTDSEDALDGVYSGDYYAAILIGEDFTSSMYHTMDNGFQSPSITYYENKKKNAIAPKITDTAVSTLQTSINQKFLEVVTSAIFTETNQLSADLKNSDGIEDFEQKLKDINTSLLNYNTMINNFIEGNAALTASVDAANDEIPTLSGKISDVAEHVTSTNASLSASEVTLENFNTNVQDSLNQIQNSLNTIADDINNAGLGNQAKITADSISQTKTDTETLLTQLNELANALIQIQGIQNSGDGTEGSAADGETSLGNLDLPQIDTSNLQMDEATKQQIQAALDTIASLQNGADDIQNALDTVQGVISDINNGTENGTGFNGSDALKETIDSDVAGVTSALSTCSQTIENMKNIYSNNLVPEIGNVLDSMSQALTNVTNLLNDLNSTLGNMGVVFDGVETTVSGVNESLRQIQTMIVTVSEKLTAITDKMDAASDDEKVQVLLELLEGDPETYGEYFSQPVSIETQEVYPIKNYGSAVAPFYTVLALWVGALILVSLIKVKAEPKNLVNVKNYQLFFGRYLLFFLLGQIQTLVTVLGNIFLLDCQVLYPGLFWFASALTSFTFTLLIYSLTLSFGDVGKALAVVIVVIQIAGSGGTYPIEILPEFFQNVYIFFPFPYAINALRETIGGMYGSAFETYLAELLVFALAALLIGLVIRIPFMKVNHFMEKRMEDTKMM